MPSAACLRATAHGASAHHMYNYAPNRCSPAHWNLQSSLEAVEDLSTIQAHNFDIPYMKESLGSKEFHNIWSRWRLFEDVLKKPETRTTMKGNCMSLDSKWLVCFPPRKTVAVCSGVNVIHHYSVHSSLSQDVIIVKKILKICGNKKKQLLKLHNSRTAKQWLYFKCFCCPDISS